jgi:Tfp pilus assembly PilM family ATPase/cell division protein FtsL
MAEFYLGISLSTSLIKLACLQKTGNKFDLFAIERFDLKDNHVTEAASLINNWVKKSLPNGSSITAVVSLPESSIFLKELELPKTKDTELGTSVFWEISSVAPIPPHQAVLQWKRISQTNQSIKVAAFVARNELIEELVDTFRKTGLNPAAVEPTSLSFGRVTSADLKKTTLLVNVNQDETNFVVLKQGAPIFSTSTEALLEKMPETRKKLSRKTTSALAASAKQAIQYWEEKGDESVKQVLITGDVLKYSGLATAIYRLTKIGTFLAKFESNKKIRIKGFSTPEINRFLVPLGAVARLVLKEDLEDVNLFPIKERKTLEKVRQEQILRNKISRFTSVTVSFLIAALVTLIGLNLWSLSLSHQTKNTQQEVDGHPAQELIAEISSVNQLTNQVEQLSSRQKNTGARLQQISQLTPTTVSFTSLKLTDAQDEAWEMSGIGNRNVILGFFGKIAADANPKNLFMPYSNLRQETDNEFVIKVWW